MNAKRAWVRWLDRPGGRGLLGAIATAYARRRFSRDVKLMYDQGWVRQLDSRSFVVDGDAFRYYAVDMIDYQEFSSQVSEVWFHIYGPKPGDTIVDVGAGCGTDTLVFSRVVGAAGRVVAIEAQPATFRLLRRTCELSALGNVDCLNVAVSDALGSARIEQKATHSENRLVMSGEAGDTVQVQAATLDGLLAELGIGTVDFLKMNIEGAERLAMDGMTTTLARTRHICVSCHDFIADATGNEWYRTRDLISARLRASGFAVTLRDQDPREAVRDQVHGIRISAN